MLDRYRARVLPLAFLVLAPAAGRAQAPRTLGPLIYLIAPGPSTQKEAGRLFRLCRWADTTVARDADAVVAVVRSSSGNPLAWSYDSLKWLRDAANGQGDETGAQFHVYIYVFTPEGPEHLQAVSHRSFDVNAGGVLTLLGQSPPGTSTWCGWGCGCY
jgi:hypothetical protein